MSSSSGATPVAERPVAERPVAEREADLVKRLRHGDEGAFAELVRRHHATMLRLASAHVPSRAVAEEVVQEAWEAVVAQIDRFEGRSTLRTWIFRIVINQAKTRGERERRTIPSSALGDEEVAGPTVDPALFQGPGGEYPGHWIAGPRAWQDPERRLASLELRAELREALGELPERQRVVVALRDVEGLSSGEVCDLMGLRQTTQRVLLHRGRAALRQRLDALLA